MFGEIHRHFVLTKTASGNGAHCFKQIFVVERQGFEVRILETDSIEPQLAFPNSAAASATYPNLESAVLDAEKEYKSNVRIGWRAITSTMPSYTILMSRRAAA
jgi:hypothetical protein